MKADSLYKNMIIEESIPLTTSLKGKLPPKRSNNIKLWEKFLSKDSLTETFSKEQPKDQLDQLENRISKLTEEYNKIQRMIQMEQQESINMNDYLLLSRKETQVSSFKKLKNSIYDTLQQKAHWMSSDGKTLSIGQLGQHHEVTQFFIDPPSVKT